MLKNHDDGDAVSVEGGDVEDDNDHDNRPR
jgi:hypothetical protein